ncbi:MAG: efflux RND transporter permease subunit [Hyphomicrobiaceae bacterium]|nr:efflux RND transporter permease subunit [Hyphomicrobiaceae bacterium]
MSEHTSDLPALSVRRPYLAAVLNLLIILAGISAIFGVEVRELPDVDRPVVTVRANYPGGSPETIDAEITARVEGAVARVNGVKSVRSSSEEDNFRIRVEFNPSVNLIDAANDVREAVSRVERELPDGVEDVFVIKADSDARPIVQLSAFSDRLTIEDVTRKVEDEIIPDLMSVRGVADVVMFGDRERVLRVVIDPMKLASYKLSVADVVAVLKDARYDVPAGSFESDRQEVLVRANASVTDPKGIEELIVRDPVRIGDVATVSFGPKDALNYVRLNGRTVINLGVVRQAQSNTVSIAKGVRDVVAQLNARFKDLTVQVTRDDSKFIEGAIHEVLISLSLAVLIVVTVIALFVRQFRAALIPAATIPIALIGTVAAIWLLGFSVNLITLLALVLAAGLVVDDAIVVLENIQRLRAQGMASRAAAVLGTRQVFFAVVATTATLVSVFLPISFLPSTAGRLFTEFGVVLSVTVCISSFVALSLVPMLAARLPDKAKQAAGADASAQRAGWLSRAYASALNAVLAAPLAVVGVCAIIGVGAFLTLLTLGEELVPKEDRGNITVFLTGPDGVGLAYTDRQVEKVEKVLQPLVDDGTITNVFTITGRWDLNRGWVEAPLLDWSKRDVTAGELIAELRKPMQDIPGAQVRIIRRNSLGLRGVGGGIKFALTGSNYTNILEAADKFVLLMEREIPQLKNTRVEFRATQPQISVDINRRRATDLGVSVESLASAIQVLVDKDEVAEITVDDQTVPIIVQATEGAVTNPSDLRRLYVSASDGRLVPLSQLIEFKEDAVAAELDRHGQRRAIEIDADLSGDFSMRDAVDAIRQLALNELPPGIGLLFLNQAAELDETSRGVIITYLVALLVVFLVLVAQFESITSAMVVLLTVPFGICAAIFALALTGTTINIYSQIGILMLIGIMAKNSILMVEFADQLRDQGKSVVEAAREASLVRSRPIVMTMVSTVLAGLPLILGAGPGAESRASIGWVVFGGLGLAAVATLFVTPVLYTLIAGWAKPRVHGTEALEAELAEVQAAGRRGPRAKRA